MLITLHPKELKNYSWIKHNKATDDLYYDSDIFTLPLPCVVELIDTKHERIAFSEEIKTVSLITDLQTDIRSIEMQSSNGNKITITRNNINSFRLHIHIDEDILNIYKKSQR